MLIYTVGHNFILYPIRTGCDITVQSAAISWELVSTLIRAKPYDDHSTPVMCLCNVSNLGTIHVQIGFIINLTIEYFCHN